MDKYTVSEESYKKGYCKGYDQCRKDIESKRVSSVSSGSMGCIVVTENVDGDRRVVTARTPMDLWIDWNNDASCCPENDAPVYGLILYGEVICGSDGWDFEDVMNLIEKALARVASR